VSGKPIELCRQLVLSSLFFLPVKLFLVLCDLIALGTLNGEENAIDIVSQSFVLGSIGTARSAKDDNSHMWMRKKRCFFFSL
jgi:hypothetical protein